MLFSGITSGFKWNHKWYHGLAYWIICLASSSQMLHRDWWHWTWSLQWSRNYRGHPSTTFLTQLRPSTISNQTKGVHSEVQARRSVIMPRLSGFRQAVVFDEVIFVNLMKWGTGCSLILGEKAGIAAAVTPGHQKPQVPLPPPPLMQPLPSSDKRDT